MIISMNEDLFSLNTELNIMENKILSDYLLTHISILFKNGDNL